jgi:hypothetical protein
MQFLMFRTEFSEERYFCEIEVCRGTGSEDIWWDVTHHIPAEVYKTFLEE